MNKFMIEADKLAKENLKTNDGGPFGAVIVLNDKIVGRGKNEVLKNKNATCHAEIMAIKDASKNLDTYDLSGCVIYTSAFPCPMCLGAIMWANIKTIYYGNTKIDAEHIGFRDNKFYENIEKINHNQKLDDLSLINIDRDLTIKTFEEYHDLNEKIY